jgi:hypothetical protein
MTKIGGVWELARQMRLRAPGVMMSQSIYVPLLGALLGVMTPAHARAGTFEDNIVALIRKVGVHGNMGVRHPTNPDVSRGVTFGPSIGLSPGNTNGWKIPVALSLFSEELHNPNGGAEFGSVRTRALLAGIGYGWHFGNLSVGPQVEVGYAMHRSSLRADASQALTTVGDVTMDVSNSWLVRPEFKAEYFVAQKWSVRSSVDYVRMRPEVTVMTPAGAIANNWDLSNVHANVGIGFYPFR